VAAAKGRLVQHPVEKTYLIVMPGPYLYQVATHDVGKLGIDRRGITTAVIIRGDQRLEGRGLTPDPGRERTCEPGKPGLMLIRVVRTVNIFIPARGFSGQGQGLIRRGNLALK
jgi:hypothetical protein